MQLNNIKDLVLKSLNKTWKQNQILSSIIYNVLISKFKDKKNIDISSYIISVKIKEYNISIKTNKPIINQEIKLFENEILEEITQKFKKIWIKKEWKITLL